MKKVLFLLGLAPFFFINSINKSSKIFNAINTQITKNQKNNIKVITLDGKSYDYFEEAYGEINLDWNNQKLLFSGNLSQFNPELSNELHAQVTIMNKNNKIIKDIEIMGNDSMQNIIEKYNLQEGIPFEKDYIIATESNNSDYITILSYPLVWEEVKEENEEDFKNIILFYGEGEKNSYDGYKGKIVKDNKNNKLFFLGNHLPFHNSYKNKIFNTIKIKENNITRYIFEIWGDDSMQDIIERYNLQKGISYTKNYTITIKTEIDNSIKDLSLEKNQVDDKNKEDIEEPRVLESKSIKSKLTSKIIKILPKPIPKWNSTKYFKNKIKLLKIKTDSKWLKIIHRKLKMNDFFLKDEEIARNKSLSNSNLTTLEQYLIITKEIEEISEKFKLINSTNTIKNELSKIEYENFLKTKKEIEKIELKLKVIVELNEKEKIKEEYEKITKKYNEIKNNLLELKEKYLEDQKNFKNTLKTWFAFTANDKVEKKNYYLLLLMISKNTWKEIRDYFFNSSKEDFLNYLKNKIIAIWHMTDDNNTITSSDISSLTYLIWKHFSYFHNLFWNLSSNQAVEITSYSDYEHGYWNYYDPSTHNKVIGKDGKELTKYKLITEKKEQEEEELIKTEIKLNNAEKTQKELKENQEKIKILLGKIKTNFFISNIKYKLIKLNEEQKETQQHLNKLLIAAKNFKLNEINKNPTIAAVIEKIKNIDNKIILLSNMENEINQDSEKFHKLNIEKTKIQQDIDSKKIKLDETEKKLKEKNRNDKLKEIITSKTQISWKIENLEKVKNKLLLLINKNIWLKITNKYKYSSKNNFLNYLKNEINSFLHTTHPNNTITSSDISSLAYLIWEHFSYFHNLFWNLSSNQAVEITSYSDYEHGYWNYYDPSTHNKVVGEKKELKIKETNNQKQIQTNTNNEIKISNQIEEYYELTYQLEIIKNDLSYEAQKLIEKINKEEKELNKLESDEEINETINIEEINKALKDFKESYKLFEQEILN